MSGLGGEVIRFAKGRRRFAQLTAGFACALLVAPMAGADDGWEQLLHKERVTVSKKEVDGRDLPIFRGVTVVPGTLYDVLAVLTDIDTQTKWMHRCIEARLLKSNSTFDHIVYNRTDAPWPVSDRDVVLRSRITVDDQAKTASIRFHAVESSLMGPLDGVVRMPHLEGHYKVRQIDDENSRVIYQIDADPGGRLPDWIIEATSKKIPLRTLSDLRSRVVFTKASLHYKEFLERWDPAWGGSGAGGA